MTFNFRVILRDVAVLGGNDSQTNEDSVRQTFCSLLM